MENNRLYKITIIENDKLETFIGLKPYEAKDLHFWVLDKKRETYVLKVYPFKSSVYYSEIDDNFVSVQSKYM